MRSMRRWRCRPLWRWSSRSELGAGRRRVLPASPRERWPRDHDRPARDGARRCHARHVSRQGRQCRRRVCRAIRRWPRAFPGEPAGLRVSGEEIRQVAAGGEHGAGHQARARRVSAVSSACAAPCQFKKNAFLKTPDATRVFLVNGEVPAIGYIIKQPELAASLELLATKGADGFYKGAFAKKLVAGVQPARWQLDRKRTWPTTRSSSVRRWWATTVARASVGVAADFGGDRADRRAEHPRRVRPRQGRQVTRTHLIVEAMRRVHRDRAVYLGDPDFVEVPVARLINKYYADGQRASIRMDQATPSTSLPGVDAPPPAPDHSFLRARQKGNMVAVTSR